MSLTPLCYTLYVGSLKIVAQGGVDYLLVVHRLKKGGESLLYSNCFNA